MEIPELPDDPAAWPKDPYAVLGVTWETPEIEIRRAYTRLIRRFKPEQFPEAFRRIREAYEACLNRSFWPSDDFAIRFRPKAEFSKLTDDEPAPSAPIEKEPHWTQAFEADAKAAYITFVEQSVRRENDIELSLRLYWLLMLDPELDAERTRHDWLARALGQSRLTGVAAELYRRELECDLLALHGPYQRVLGAAANPQDLCTVVRWRVAAAGRFRCDSEIEGDLDVVRERIRNWNESSWLGLLVGAIDWVAWSRSDGSLDFYAVELKSLRHLELRDSYAFDRIDEVQRLSLPARSLDMPSEIVDVARLYWADPNTSRAREIAALARSAMRDPGRLVRKLDRSLEEWGTAFVALLMRALEDYRQRNRTAEEPGIPFDSLRNELRTRMAAHRQAPYSQTREPLLKWLIEDSIDPLEFVQVCETIPDGGYRDMHWTIRGDLSLRAVWLAAVSAD